MKKQKTNISVDKTTKDKKVTADITSNSNEKKQRKLNTFFVKLLPSHINPKLLVSVIVLTLILLIVSSYAWLSASLDVQVRFFDLKVSSDSGLFISLDGVKFSESIEISMDSIISELKKTYPNNTNQWSSGGMWPVSSNGPETLNSDKFAVYVGEVSKNKSRTDTSQKTLNTVRATEDEANSANVYIAFDIFLKNVSGSPKSDNLYFDDDTYIDYDYDRLDDMDDAYGTAEEIIDSMQGIMNSVRFGLVKIGSVSSKSDINTIQNIKCNNACQTIIFEPNSTLHTDASIEKAKIYDVDLIDGQYFPTYAIIGEGTKLQMANGQAGTGIPLDTEHFALQQTITNFDSPIFQIPNGITKLRAYVWIEGQDLDSLATNSKGAPIDIVINFVKDLAGYE